MSTPSALLVRVQACLLRRLVPSLQVEYAEQANRTFAQLYQDAREGSVAARVRFVARELGSLLACAWTEHCAHAEQGAAAGFQPSSVGVAPDPGGRRRRGGGRAVLAAALRDLRYAARNLGRSPGFAALAIASLTLGIASATLLFGVVNAALFRLPRHAVDPARLVVVRNLDPLGEDRSWSVADYEAVRGRVPVLAETALVGMMRATVETPSGREGRIACEQISANYFAVLGVRMAAGSPLLAEDTPAGPDVVIIGSSFWEREFGGDPAVVGRAVRVNGRPHTIVGVAPPGMVAHDWPPVALDLWVPIDPRWRTSRDLRLLTLIARVRGGVPIERVETDLNVIARRLRDAEGAAAVAATDRTDRLQAAPITSARTPIDRRQRVHLAAVAAVLASLVGLLMLVICSNLANMLLMRATGRQREFAIRMALGAGRWRLIAQLTAESLVLSGVAAVFAVLVAHVVTAAVASGWTDAPLDFTIDARVAAFSVGVAVVTAVVFGLAPAWRAARTDLTAAFKPQPVSLRLRRRSLRVGLVVLQVAGAFVAVVAASLLIRSIYRVTHTQVGFDSRNVAVLSVNLPPSRYPDVAGRRFFAEAIEHLAAVPGVERATVATVVPLGYGHRPAVRVWRPGADAAVAVAFNAVAPGFFAVLRMPMLRGRDFGRSDTAGSGRVAIVNEALAERCFPGVDPIGQQLLVDDPTAVEGDAGAGRPTPRVAVAVIGVVRNAKYHDAMEPTTPHLWSPFDQAYARRATLHVRSTRDVRSLLPELRARIRVVDATLAVSGLGTLEAVVDGRTAPLRTAAAVFTAGGVATLGLAMMGIYGVMSYAMSLRKREIGVRLALGERPSGVVGSVLREGVTLAVVGSTIGLCLVAAGGRLMASMLVGVGPWDPVAIGGSLLLLFAASAAAVLQPAIRAARVDPIETLRAE